jgi:hypothetical protein
LRATLGGLDDVRPDNGAGSVENLGTVRLRARTECYNAIVLDQHNAVHRDDGAALEANAKIFLRAQNLLFSD